MNVISTEQQRKNLQECYDGIVELAELANSKGDPTCNEIARSLYCIAGAIQAGGIEEIGVFMAEFAARQLRILEDKIRP